jgi:Uncharacterized protein conserved in bacteria
MMLEEKLIQIMKTYEYLMRDLRLVQGLGLSNWCIAAGYVRNYVWDYLQGYSVRTPLNDVDVIYFDASDLTEESEKRYESLLRKEVGGYNWSFKNQARMHIRNQEKPYMSISDAMKRWPETVTAVGISLEGNEFKVTAPHGLDDLFSLVIRRSPYFTDKDHFYARIQSKNWLEYWPQLKIVEE